MIVQVTVRELVKIRPRSFCCRGCDKASCDAPQYSEHDDKPGCKSFRCTRCKSTVGWCSGAVHEEGHPANNWCDACWCEVYLDGEL
jgi:hypothetical protein